MHAAPAPPPPPAADAVPSMAGGIERKMSPGVVLLIAILAMVFFIVGLLNLLIQNLLRLRRARRRRGRVGDASGDGSPTAFQGQLQQLFNLHDAGVDQAFIDALPVFPYHAVAGHHRRRRDGKEEEDDSPFDCAVCLCEFAADDKLRLLPTCGHAFHVPCIDAWLLSHSTCPLCRGSILLADVECYSPGSTPAALLVQPESSEGLRETVAGDGDDPGDRGMGEAPKDVEVEEILEVKLGKLRCVDGNVSARDLAVDGNGRGSLGKRRCLSMGSYEYVMDEHAALRVAVKATTPKRRAAAAAGSWSRRRHALSASDFGSSNSKKGAWETAVMEANAGGDGAATRLNKDSFSTSKIWMVARERKKIAIAAGGKREEEDSRTGGSERRAASFRWPAMSVGCKKHRGGEAEADETWDVEVGGRGGNGTPARAEERPSLARAAMIWVAGGRQGSLS